MGTQINVTVDSGGLSAKAKQLQSAARQAQLEGDRNQRVEAEGKTQRDAKLAAEGRAPDGSSLYGTPGKPPEIDRRPAANRTSSGSVGGVSYTTALNTSNNTLSITVGPPGLVQSVTVSGLDGGFYPSPQSLPASTSSGEIDLPAVGLLGQDRATSRWVWDLDWPANTLGYGVRTVDAQPPNSATAFFTLPTSTSISTNQDQQLLLPLGKNTSLFIYVRNWFKQFTVYSRVNTDVYSTAQVWSVADDSLYINKSYRSRLENSSIEDVFDHKELYSGYSMYAFVVGPSSVRQIAVPPGLESNIRALYPPVAPNATAEFDQRATREILRPAFLGGDAYTTPWVITKGQRDSFDFNKWRTTARYGDYPTFAGADALPRHFGLLDSRLNRSYFTPAIYRFIQGPMTIDSNSVNYAFMRTNYFANAPSFYLGECRVEEVVSGEVVKTSCSDEKVGFDVTRTQPVTLSTEIPASDFRKNAKYDVLLNGASRSSVMYAWDWDKPSFCRQQALALGFSAADLTP
jgi:hypothetical protein